MSGELSNLNKITSAYILNMCLFKLPFVVSFVGIRQILQMCSIKPSSKHTRYPKTKSTSESIYIIMQRTKDRRQKIKSVLQIKNVRLNIGPNNVFVLCSQIGFTILLLCDKPLTRPRSLNIENTMRGVYAGSSSDPCEVRVKNITD